MSKSDETLSRGTTLTKLLGPAKIATLRLLWQAGRRPALEPIMLDPKRSLAVGRTVTSPNVALDDPHASRLHATFRAADGGATIEDHSQNGTFVNGARVEGRAFVGDGDLVRIGDTFLLLRIRGVLPEVDDPVQGLDGTSPGMVTLRRGIAAVAPTPARVLILGETGTGKEVTARALHQLGGRSGAFVAVNCAAIPESLAESQLFGHVRGAFTDARADHSGFFRAADGGTLFLDEIGELSAPLQAKLLRVLEERVVMPVGATTEVPVDVRLVAATHRDLHADVDAHRFRGDLYARIAEYTLRTPPLRSRREDILPILETALGPEVPPLDADLVHALLLHTFRFNVRELLAIGRQLVIDGRGAERLELEHAGGRLDQRGSQPVASGVVTKPAIHLPAARLPTPSSGEIDLDDPMDTAEREPPPSKERLLELVAELRGNVSEIARVLGRSRRQVRRYLETHGIDIGAARTT